MRARNKKLVYQIFVALFFHSVSKRFFFTREWKKNAVEWNWTNLRVSTLKIDAKCELCRQYTHTHTHTITAKTLGNLIKWQNLNESNAKQTENKKDSKAIKCGTHKLPVKLKKVLNVGKIIIIIKNGCRLKWYVCAASLTSDLAWV